MGQKKKRNKQSKANENLNSENSDAQNRGLQQTVVLDSDRESVNGAESSRSGEADKSYRSNRDASLEEKIKELQEQLDVHVQREAELERNISQSQKERSLWHHKETELETRILQLQTEKDSWLQKEVSFEEKRIQMEEEKVNLAKREKSAVEAIASLNKDNTRLQAQVMELEASIQDISRQNQHLQEHVSYHQSKIQDLENSHISSERIKHGTEYEDMKSQLESARALVAKLVSENEKLVEKVNILHAELDQKSVTTQSSSSSIETDDQIVQNSKPATAAADMDETLTDPMPSSAEKLDTVRSKDGMPSDLNQVSRVSIESGEIVQISLDESDVTVATSAISFPEIAEAVPLTDAPLIGAPFRLISFVARYVSGADLVQK